MVSTNIILILTIAINVAVIHVKNANAESGDIFIQSPSQYCSNERAPCIAKEELDRLSALGLGVPSSKETDVSNTSEHVGMSSQTEHDTSSVVKYDLNLTIEENEKMLSSTRK